MGEVCVKPSIPSRFYNVLLTVQLYLYPPYQSQYHRTAHLDSRHM